MDQPPHYPKNTCPFHNPGLVRIWSKGRRDALQGHHAPPKPPRSPGALEAYTHGYKLGLREQTT